MRIVGGAKKSVKATMLAKEEAGSPLPSDYFSLLKKKMTAGVHVIRIGFGSEKEFASLKKNVQIRNKNYEFYCLPKTGYQRMLLIDDSKLMFAKTIGKKRSFFYTEEPKTIAKYKKFFEKHL